MEVGGRERVSQTEGVSQQAEAVSCWEGEQCPAGSECAEVMVCCVQDDAQRWVGAEEWFDERSMVERRGNRLLAFAVTNGQTPSQNPDQQGWTSVANALYTKAHAELDGCYRHGDWSRTIE